MRERKIETEAISPTVDEMLCPLCKAKLVKGQPHRYETLDEHVCNPNGIRPVRGTLVCSNCECATHNTETFWANDGEGPFSAKVKDHEWIDNNPLPFGSYHRAMYFRLSYHEEDRRFKLGKLTIKRAVSYESDDYGHKKNKCVRYTIWWNNILYYSGLRMLMFSIRRFYRVKKLGREMAVKEARNLKESALWPRVGTARKSFLRRITRH